MRNSFILFLLFAFAGLYPCQEALGQVTTEVVEVGHYRQFCEAVVPKKCLVIKREDGTEFRAVQDEIENFDFIPGYHYLLRVEIEKVAAPPKDTSGWIYRLKEIVGRTEVRNAGHAIDLYGSKWRLVRMNDEPVKEASGAWVAFDGARGRIYGYGGCNSFNGGFAIEDQQFSAPKLVSTKRACLIDWGVEDGFLKALARGGEIEVRSDSLLIRSGDVEILKFVPFE
ncbi:MAG: META domain-containing protein [Acidobacteriota bacterium]|nr:MAG: META domain-containing protein [Acidobacteriota bacterium]